MWELRYGKISLCCFKSIKTNETLLQISDSFAALPTIFWSKLVLFLPVLSERAAPSTTK